MITLKETKQRINVEPQQQVRPALNSGNTKPLITEDEFEKHLLNESGTVWVTSLIDPASGPRYLLSAHFRSRGLVGDKAPRAGWNYIR